MGSVGGRSSSGSIYSSVVGTRVLHGMLSVKCMDILHGVNGIVNETVVVGPGTKSVHNLDGIKCIPVISCLLNIGATVMIDGTFGLSVKIHVNINVAHNGICLDVGSLCLGFMLGW